MNHQPIQENGARQYRYSYYDVPPEAGSGSLDVQKFLKKLRSNWYLFAITIPLFLVLGYVNIKITEPAYRVQARLLIQEKSEENQNLGSSRFNEDGIKLFSSKKNIQNEIGVLKSYELLKETLDYLYYEISYYKDGSWRMSERYQGMPIHVIMDENHVQLSAAIFELRVLAEDRYQISVNAESPKHYFPDSEETIWLEDQTISFTAEGKFGEFFENEHCRLLIQADTTITADNIPTEKIFFKITDINTLAEKYRNRLEVATVSEDATILKLASEGPVPAKEVDFLNAHCQKYIQRQLQEKNQFAQGTIDFIEEQLASVSDSLKGTERALAAVRRNPNTINIKLTASNAVEQLRQLEDQRSDINGQLEYYNEMLVYLEQKQDLQSLVAPSTIGINDPLLNKLVLDLKESYSEREAKSISSGEGSLEMQLLNRQIENTQNSLQENVRNIKRSTEISLRNLNRRMGEVRSVISSLPQNEQRLNRIERKFDFNDNLYNYLLEKRMEAKIAKAANSADSKVLDQARRVGTAPISPNKIFIMAGMLLLAIFLPLIWIFARDYMENRVTEVKEIEARVKVPVLGQILHAPHEVDPGNIWTDERALAVTETFRYLFVNMQFLAFEKKSKTIAFTSTIPGEGKTFCAVNLGQVIASSGKSTILIGADIRKPRMYRSLNVENRLGLTHYLTGQAELKEVIQSTGQKRLKCITSGPVPPNPAELLDSPRFSELLAELEKTYDYIIIDTPPAGLFADFLTLSKHADLNFYIVRHKYTRLEYLADIEKLRLSAGLKRFYLILNDVKYGSGRKNRYGYDYSYKYKDKPESTNGKNNGKSQVKKLIKSK